MKVPMLDKEEFQLCWDSVLLGRRKVEKEIKSREVTNYIWLGEIPKSYEKYRFFIDMYRVITGFVETNPNAIMHHRIEQFGDDCPNCHKSLRTPLARYCVECGLGMDDLIDQQTKPLMERRKKLFDKR